VTTDRLPLELVPPDLRPWRTGNQGLPYVWSFEAPVAGPHVVLNALMHGNEFSGALALVRLLEADLRPSAGRLTIIFANVAAFERFDPDNPRRSRFVDEDMNRVWDGELAQKPANTAERRRARELLPFFEEADYLLDLHSMHRPSPALILSGWHGRGRRLAASMGVPEYVVADRGHANGTRLIEFGRFGNENDEATALLLEAGQHWSKASARVAFDATIRFLEVAGVIDAEIVRAFLPNFHLQPQRFVEVTDVVTAQSADFAFTRDVRGMDVVGPAGTVIAYDEQRPVLTPYDRCVLVMPSQRFVVGQTAVRLGRFVDGPRA
jgi:predicted deacylase